MEFFCKNFPLKVSAGFMLVNERKQKLQNLQYFKKAISGLKKIIFSCDFLTFLKATNNGRDI